MINARFSGAAQSRAIGTWTAWTGTAFVIGPLLGGVLVDAVGWRWIFAVNIVPLALTLYLTTKLGADEFAPAADRQDAKGRSARIDVVGAALNAVGLTGAVYALIEGQRLGFSYPPVVAGLAIGLTCLAVFPWWESRSGHPMMPLHIFAARNFAVGNLATVFLYAAVSLGTLIITLFLQETAGLSYLWMMMAREPFNFWTQILPGMVVFGLGLSMTVSPLTAAILGAVDPARSGIGSAVNNAVSRISGLIAIAFTGVIISLGGRSDGKGVSTVDFAGFRQGALVAAILFAVAGVISAIGIRNGQGDYSRVSEETTAGCHDRVTPPPAYTRR